MFSFLKKSIALFSLLFLMGNCSPDNTPTNDKNQFAVMASTPISNNQFKEYWYQGKAEITSYDLQQGRYGELHQGSAVLIFVTEDFSKKKQVKLDYPSKNPKDAIPVLKLNTTRKFNTGIYPYSTMQSIFSPINQKDNSGSLKVSTSSQEWCGHTFMQLNQKGNSYQVQGNSYFESEGDTNSKIEKALLEDEIFNLIRINPKNLPDGKIKIIPSTLFARLRHIDFKVESATASMESKGDEMVFTLKYDSIERTVVINFEKAFPHQILSWSESNKSGFGPSAKTLTTTATKKKSLLLDYWSKHDIADMKYRKELGLE